MAKKIVALARSPLADKTAIKLDGYQQTEVQPLAKIIIRGKSTDDAFCQAVESTLKIKLPTAANTSAAAGGSTLLWLGPEEWLLWTAEKKGSQTISQLTQALNGLHAAVINVTDYYTIIRISGDKSKSVLAHGCPLDIRDTQFRVGSCAQSHYRNAGILLYRTKDGYDIQIRWSFADYLWEYLAGVGELL